MIKKTETFESLKSSLEGSKISSREFYVDKREDVPMHSCLSSYRRDFYKIALLTFKFSDLL